MPMLMGVWVDCCRLPSWLGFERGVSGKRGNESLSVFLCCGEKRKRAALIQCKAEGDGHGESRSDRYPRRPSSCTRFAPQARARLYEGEEHLRPISRVHFRKRAAIFSPSC